MPPNPGYKVTKDGGLIISPTLAVANDESIKVPQVDTAYGAGFGDTLSDSDRAFAACREPIAHKLTYGTAADITDKWFTVNDPDTEESDPALDRTVQKELIKLEAQKKLTDAFAEAFIYKKSLIVCAFNDAKSVLDFSKPLRIGAELRQIEVYPRTFQQQKYNDYTIDTKDMDPNSLRYGKPLIYKVDRGDGNYLYVHYSRCIEVDNGASVLDVVWDDICCGRNIRWGTSQYMYRTGGGFPVIGFPSGTTAEQLTEWGASGAFTNLMSRTYIAIAQNSAQENTGMTFEFKGPAGSAIDPTPFYNQNIQQVAIATGFPQPDLVGAQAGAVTGSDVNMQNKYKIISRYQTRFEYVVRWLIDRLAESGQVKLIKPSSTVAADNQVKILKQMLKRFIRRDYRHKSTGKYIIEWNSAFELSEKDLTQIDLQHAQAQSTKLEYMSKDEVRAEDGLDPLPDGAGEWKDAPEFGGEEFLVKSKVGMKKNADPNSKAKKPDDPTSNANNQSSN